MGKKADLIAVQNKFGAFEDTHDLGAKVGLGEGAVVRLSDLRCRSDSLAEALAIAMETFDRSGLPDWSPPAARRHANYRKALGKEAQGASPRGEGYGIAV